MDLVQEIVQVALSEYVLHIILNRIHIFLHTKNINYDMSSFGMEDGEEVVCVFNHLPYEINLCYILKKKKIVH